MDIIGDTSLEVQVASGDQVHWVDGQEFKESEVLPKEDGGALAAPNRASICYSPYTNFINIQWPNRFSVH